MTPKEFNDLKVATEKLTSWDSSGKAFGHFQDIASNASSSSKADRIYEFYSLMRLLEDLLVNYKIVLKDGSQKGKLFPKSPANKIGYPYFVIEHKTKLSNKYQVCYGTKIKLSYAPLTKIAPDISIQSINSTDDPDESMIELIMDAKFKYDNDDTLPVDQIHSFIQRVNALQTKNADLIDLELDKLFDIKSNCLLTNGKGLQDHQQYCEISKIKQVEKFNVGDLYQVIG